MTKPRETTDEFLARLQEDPAWVAARAREEAEMARAAEERRKAEAPLVRDLHAAGFPVTSAWDFVNRRNDYDAALPILLEHLQRPYPSVVKQGIARALAVPNAQAAWPVLVRLFRQEPNEFT